LAKASVNVCENCVNPSSPTPSHASDLPEGMERRDLPDAAEEALDGDWAIA